MAGVTLANSRSHQRPERYRQNMKKSLMKKISWILFLSALVAFATGASPVWAKPALWKLSDPDTTIYLFGTVHLLKAQTQWFDPDLKAAFESSNELVVELVEPDPAEFNRVLLHRAVDADGPPLSSKLSSDDVQHYSKAMADLGLSPHAFEQLKPWSIALLLTLIRIQNLGYAPQHGVDKVLIQMARASDKSVVPLESPDDQLSILDELPEADQIKWLQEVVRTLLEKDSSITQIVQHWLAGDMNQLMKLFNQDMDQIPSLKSALMTNRNKRWTDWLVKRLDTPGTVFVAVGAAHLAGDDSVQTMLKGRKLSVERIR